MSKKNWIYSIFFLSGASGLIYETVWLRVLTRVLGNTVYATSVILAAFMAGLALGSFAIDSWSKNKQNLLRFYAYLELGIGLCAIVLLFILPNLTPLYRIFYHLAGDNRLALTAAQSAMLFILLLVPTFLMGGTLPLLTSYTRRHEASFTGRTGYLYGINTLGAVIGVLGSGMILIGSIGEMRTVIVGAVLNLFAAYIAYSLSGTEGTAPSGATKGQALEDISPYSDTVKKFILIAYALSGFTAMAYEIVWTRIFQLYIGTSIYAFSLMLGAYLIGLGAGSIWGARQFERAKDPLPWFGMAQAAIAFYGIFGLYLLAYFIQPFQSNMDLVGMIVVPLIIITPITFLLGALFPAMSKSFVKNEADVVRSVGRLYALNTIGCILGSLACGFIFISALGTKNTVLLLAGINVLIGASALLYSRALSNKLSFRVTAAGSILVILIMGVNLPDPFLWIAKDRAENTIQLARSSGPSFFYHKENAAATTTAFGLVDLPQTKKLLINGTGVTKLCLETKLMAHLPILLHPHPRSFLAVCFGMGTTLRSAWTYKDLRCDVVDLVPEVYECFKYFHANGPKILADPRVRHFVDDGRNYLLMRRDTYDVITVDPSPPTWSAGTVNLYSREFFALCKQHLNAKGLICLWIPPAQASEVRMIMKTFMSVFPNTYAWHGNTFPGFYMIGLPDGSALDLERFDREDRNRAILADLNEWDNIKGVKQLKQFFLAGPDELERSLKGAPVITDDMPYTEFPLWRSLFDQSFAYKLDLII